MGKMTHRYQVKVGQNYQGWIKLINTSDKIQQIKLYQRDYSFIAEGKTFYSESASTARSNGNWISLSQKQLQIPPGEIVKVYYEIKVPQKKKLNGTYWSLIMVETVPFLESREIKNMKNKLELSIGHSLRYGVQIVTNMEDLGESELIFKNEKLLKRENSDDYYFEIDLLNQGQYWLIPRVWMEIYQEDGQKIGVFEGQQLRIFPGTSVREKIIIGNLDKGRYIALIIADNEDENVFGKQYQIEIK
jgi:hypothetical protein